MPSKKAMQIVIRLDEDLYFQSRGYVEQRGTTVAAVVRAMLRELTNPDNPRPLPAEIAAEVQRAVRRERPAAENVKATESDAGAK